MKPGADTVEIYDTTLRDGAQREGISWSLEDKRRIARRLDALGIDLVEGGWPGSNPKDAELFAGATSLGLKGAKLAAFGSTRRAGLAAADDPNVQALLEAGTPVCTIFGKSSVLHVEEVLRTTRDENLRMIEDTVRCLVAAGRRVIYDAEHFFDGHALEPAYALETLRAAVRGGASTLVLCDTNGGSLPWQVGEIVAAAVGVAGGAAVGIHAHDDAGCGVANTLAAVRAGARHVQGTINGFGERCGNANLCAVIPGIELKLGLGALPSGRLRQLPEVSRFVAELANVSPDAHMPYVGRSAFAHKGGVHVAAIRRHAMSYQHVDPEAVGNECRVVVSELAGRTNVLAKAEEHGITVDKDTPVEVLAQLKVLESQGYSFEAAEASVAMLLRRRDPSYEAPFQVLDYRVLGGQGRDQAFAEATVKLVVDGQVHHTVAEGDGPVHALDTALRKALVDVLPTIAAIKLTDYKVRILDGRAGTSAIVRVLIDFFDGERRWSTVGASTNIIEASWLALCDGLEHGLALTRDQVPTAKLLEVTA